LEVLLGWLWWSDPLGGARDGSVVAFLGALRTHGAEAEKCGNTPDVDAAEPARCPRGDERFGCIRGVLLPPLHLPRSPARLEDVGPATSPLRVPLLVARECNA
jgi:hypothetical protein